jgi:hypothetical protein
MASTSLVYLNSVPVAGEVTKTTLAKLMLLVTPLLLTPAWGYFLAEGFINLGGGEKDILMLIPCLARSILFLVSGIVFRKHAMHTMPLQSLACSAGIILIFRAGLLVYSFIV